MIRRISALIWLRTQMILSNGAMLFQIIFPYALLVLYDRFLNPDHDPSKSLQILFIMLPLAFSISMGTMITIMLAEEKEKKNLKTLFLSGIHSAEYFILSSSPWLHYDCELPAYFKCEPFKSLSGIWSSDDKRCYLCYLSEFIGGGCNWYSSKSASEWSHSDDGCCISTDVLSI